MEPVTPQRRTPGPRSIAVWVLLILGLLYRLQLLDQHGGDFHVWTGSVEEVLRGENPYVHTQKSFEIAELDHWYAYLPLWLYLNIVSYLISSLASFLHFVAVMKFPVLVADFLIVLLLWKILRPVGFFFAFTASAAWLFNAHLLIERNYTHFEPPPNLFVLLSLYWLDRREAAASASLALAIGFKQFPILLAPYLLGVAKNRMRFIVFFGGTLFLISLPFLIWNPGAFIYSILVSHMTRGFGGNSVPEILGHGLGVSIPAYSGLLLIVASYVWAFAGRKRMGRYAFASLVIGILLVTSPVLFTRYPLWLLPVFLAWAGLFSRERSRPKVTFALLAGGLYALYSLYLRFY